MSLGWIAWSKALIRLLSTCVLSSPLPVQLAESGSAPTLDAVASFHTTTWTRSQGLPEEWIECLLQTRDGYLWMGSPEGLMRFDGTGFLLVNSENCPAMTSTVCKALAEDLEGNLWLATKRGALRFGRNAVDRFGMAEGLVGEETTSLCPSRAGGMWIGTSGGVALWRQGRITTFPPRSFGKPFVYSVMEDAQGQVWAGMLTGLYRLDVQTGEYAQVWGRHSPDSEADQDIVRCLREARAGGFWAGTDHSLLRVQDGRVDVMRLGEPSQGNRVKCLWEDRNQVLWAVIGNVLHRLRAGRFEALDGQLGLTDTVVNAVHEDRQGTLWVGSRHGGLTRVKPLPSRVFTSKDGLWNQSVRSVAPSRRGGIWLATASGVGSFREGRFQRILTDEKWADVGLSSVAEDPQGRLWIGTMQDGLFECSPDTDTRRWSRVLLWMTSCRTVLIDRGSNFWAGFSQGLLQSPATAARLQAPGAHWWLPGSRPGVWAYSQEGLNVGDRRVCWLHRNGEWFPVTSTERIPLPDGYGSKIPEPWLDQLLFHNTPGCFDIRALAEGHDGSIWLGTATGGLEHLQDQRFRRFGVKDGLPGDVVNALWTDSEGTVWVGTTAGLGCVRDGRLLSFARLGGPFQRGVTALIGDAFGCLWMGTDAGIYRFRRDDLKALATESSPTSGPGFTVLDETDGLPSTAPSGGGQPAACLTPDGKVWFATTQGLVQITPPPPEALRPPVPIHVEDVIADGFLASRNPPWMRRGHETMPLVAGEPNGVVQFPPGSGRRLELRYTALDLGAPERLQFAYQLVGNDPKWVQAGSRRTAYYTNLRPGKYRFEIAMTDRHQTLRDPRPDAVLAFEILPFLHETLWFRAVAGLSVGLGALGFVAWRSRDRMRRHELEQRVALAEQRSRIADDLHDEIGAGLSRVVREAASGSTDEAQLRLDRLALELRGVLSDLDQIVWLLQPDQDTLGQFVDRLHQIADRWFQSEEIRRRWHVPTDLPELPLSTTVRREILLFVKEALTNVLKHAAANEVCLGLSLDDASLILVISDDGKGFAPEGANLGGTGLSSLNRRAQRLGATFTVESRPGAGTKVRLQVPRQNLNSEGERGTN